MTMLDPTFELLRPIERFCDWTRPKDPKKQWKPGRSAQELAHSWFRNGRIQMPVELAGLLASSPITREAVITQGRPEHVTPLPMRGEGRNHDLWLKGHVGPVGLTLCVEAKADEPFDLTVAGKIAALGDNAARSGLPERARQLLQLLFGSDADALSPPWSGLRYQLVAGLAGTVRQAERDGSSVAVFVVHEFATRSTTSEAIAKNRVDFEHFRTLLFGERQSGDLSGPVSVGAAASTTPIQVCMGKVTVAQNGCAPEFQDCRSP